MIINIDPTSDYKSGRYVHPYTVLYPLKSISGIEYSSLRAIDKYLKVQNTSTFKHLVNSPQHKAKTEYKQILASSKGVSPVPHHKSVILFFVWERYMLDSEFRHHIKKIGEIWKRGGARIQCSMNDEYTLYNHWYPRVIKEVIRCGDTSPRFNNFCNKRYKNVKWTACIPGNKLSESELINKVRNARHLLLTNGAA
jgi:uncharacterized protein Usg